MTQQPYRVELMEDGRWHLFIRHADGSEYDFHNYESEVTAKMIGYQATSRRPTTEDGWRARRRSMRAG